MSFILFHYILQPDTTITYNHKYAEHSTSPPSQQYNLVRMGTCFILKLKFIPINTPIIIIDDDDTVCVCIYR